MKTEYIITTTDNKISAIEEIEGWVDCKTRTPEADGMYIVTLQFSNPSKRYPTVAKWFRKQNSWLIENRLYNNSVDNFVIHWREFPKVYEDIDMYNISNHLNPGEAATKHPVDSVPVPNSASIPTSSSDKEVSDNSDSSEETVSNVNAENSEN